MGRPGLLDVVSRYEALLRLSPALSHHRSIDDLIGALADQLHAVVPFEYLALVLHDAATDEMRLQVLEPADLPSPAIRTLPVAAGGPGAQVWQKQQPTVIPIPPDGPLGAALEYIRGLGQTVTCWLPLTTVHGRFGVLSFGSSCATDYPVDAIAFMEQVAAHVAVSVDNAINFDQARHLEQQLRGERDRLQLLLEINNLLGLASRLPVAADRHVRGAAARDHARVRQRRHLRRGRARAAGAAGLRPGARHQPAGRAVARGAIAGGDGVSARRRGGVRPERDRRIPS
jgi:GAF domain-containing protein